MKILKLLLSIFTLTFFLLANPIAVFAQDGTCKCSNGYQPLLSSACLGDSYSDPTCPSELVCCKVPDTNKNGATSGEKPLGRIGEGEGFGPWANLGLFENVGPAAQAFAKIISNIIGIMTLIAGIWFIFQFIIGAFSIMSASGDPKKMGEASAKIRTAVIGLVVIVVAYALMSLLGKILGFDFLRPAALIEKLGPK